MLSSRALFGIVAASLFVYYLIKPKEMGGSLSAQQAYGPPVVMGTEALMSKKAHGTCANAPMQPLRWNVDYETCDRVCCFNRHYAEHSGYFQGVNAYWNDLKTHEKIEYFDSVSGKLLFTAPIGRTMDEFIRESKAHGWPSFRDAEVEWANLRVLPGGEAVSVDGTHLGHNIADAKGNRYCINLVCIAGQPSNK